MIPHDREDHARIARHLREREGWGFTTLECGKDITNCIIDKNINGSFLFDSVTALLANEMFPGPEPDLTAPARVKQDLLALAESCGISSAAALKLIRSITARQDSYLALCRESWLPEDMKTGLADLICRRMAEMQ